MRSTTRLVNIIITAIEKDQVGPQERVRDLSVAATVKAFLECPNKIGKKSWKIDIVGMTGSIF